MNQPLIRFSSIFTILSLTFSINSYAQLDPLLKNEAKPVAAVSSITDLPIAKDPKKDFAGMEGMGENVYNYIPKSGGYAKMESIKLEHLNPRVASFVDDYIDRHASSLNELKMTAKPYFDMMDEVLTMNGIPKELKYLAVIESHLKASVTSWAGAVGPWQFMPETGRNMGLVVNRNVDQRRDYLKSTWAASKYLNYLYDIYSDWLLVVAAYNCGPGRVNSAIKRAGSRNFWDLQYHLPTESRNHVKKFIATHYIMEGQGGVTTVPQEEQVLFASNNQVNTTIPVKVQTISGRYMTRAILKYLQMSMEEFNKLNPNLEKSLATNNTYQLRLPVEKFDIFLAKKNDMLNESIQMIMNPDYRL